MTWFAENLGTIFVGGLLIGTVMLLVGALATWRTAKRLRHPARQLLRFCLSLVLLGQRSYEQFETEIQRFL